MQERGGELSVSKYLAIGLMGYLIGRHRKYLGRQFCRHHIWKRAHRIIKRI